MKKIIQNTFLIFGSLLFCTMLFELGVRIFAEPEFDYTQASADESALWQYDAKLGWAMQPNGQCTFSRPEFSSEIQTNAFGLRDDDFSKEKAKDEFRILLLGDSVVAGFEVQRDGTMEAQLEKRLNRQLSGKKIQVINAGVRGYGTDQELLYLLERGMALQPDIVVLGFVPANDLENNVTVHTAGRIFSKPCFVFDEAGHIALRGIPVPDYDLQKQIYSAVMPQRPEPVAAADGNQNALKVFLSKKLRSYAFVARRLKTAPPEFVGWLKKRGILHNSLPPEQVDFYRFPLNDDWTARWKITLAIIEQMHAFCIKNETDFLLWSFPQKEQIYSRDRVIFTRSFAVDDDELDFDQPEKKLRTFARQNKMQYVETAAGFRHRAKSGERFHFITDHHLNENGHRLMAEILATHITKKTINELK
ncbi:MAG: hypothetical protein DWQ10_04145 [Calditrichaeota bacterium]|nr:MAG: hypothetical protein DWQ10_04145 [Calditrichota bacterium]